MALAKGFSRAVKKTAKKASNAVKKTKDVT